MAIKRHKIKEGEWIEIHHINDEDISFLKKEFPKFHPTNLKDAREPVIFPKLDIYDDYFFMSDTVPIHLEQGQRAESYEVHMFVMRNSIITITNEEATIFKNELNDNLEDEYFPVPENAHSLAYLFMNKLYSLSDDVITNITTAVQRVDDHVLEVRSTWLIREIAILQRNVIYFLTSINASVSLFQALEQYAKQNTDATKEYWGDLEDRLHSQKELLEDYEKLLTVLAKAHEMVVNRRTNRIITVLTVFSAIFLPLNLIAGIYGMNIDGLPFALNGNAFWLIISAMLICAISLYFYFTSKNWS